jgi:hypothetical protein
MRQFEYMLGELRDQCAAIQRPVNIQREIEKAIAPPEYDDMPALRPSSPLPIRGSMQTAGRSYLVLNSCGGGSTLQEKYGHLFLDPESYFSSTERQMLKSLRLQEKGLDRASAEYRDAVERVVAEHPHSIVIRVHSIGAVPAGYRFKVMPVAPTNGGRTPHGQRNSMQNYRELLELNETTYTHEDVESWVRLEIASYLVGIGYPRETFYEEEACHDELVK